MTQTMKSMVPMADLDSMQDQVRTLKSLMGSMCVDTQRTISSFTDNTKAEIREISKALDGLASRSELMQKEHETKIMQQDIERLQHMLASMVPETELSISQDLIKVLKSLMGIMCSDTKRSVRNFLDNAKAEIREILKALDGLVPRSELIQKEHEAVMLQQEIQRLHHILGSMVPQATLDDCLDQLNKGQLQIQILNSKIAGMVPKTLLDSATQEIESLTDKLEVAGLECVRLRQLVKDMVPRERLEDRSVASKGSQGNRERSAVQYDQSARDELRHSLDEVGQLRSEVVRQQKLIESMVSKTRLIAAEEEIADLKAELDRRRTLQKDMVQRSELDKCTESAIAMVGSVTVMQTELS
eukprot:CAMPEP_0172209028 /NCGR_PEP_ID=MMETSP1050-20130122/34855_1 /TAXON_ID=233186 /ORGANISM="Cryptomonas curvata, Strain CCAP979/52" /LENGTH=356 /DNA_ID=CAMNT_0012888795 /DNA_START=113 /DNA_END=1179 /DNA_ORIENTATION=+